MDQLIKSLYKSYYDRYLLDLDDGFVMVHFLRAYPILGCNKMPLHCPSD